MTDAAEERIQAYLDQVLLAARGGPREARGLLAEVEEHLRESVAALSAEGLDETRAVEEALRRFGPAPAVTRGSSRAAYATLAGQLAETAPLLGAVVFLAVGVAAVPVAIVGLTGPPASAAQLTDVVRNHLLCGVAGFAALAAWWTLHVRRQARPSVLPVGFGLAVCGTAAAAVAAALLAFGLGDIVLHTGADGPVSPADLVATGATVTASALFCWILLARRVTRPPLGAESGPGAAP